MSATERSARARAAAYAMHAQGLTNTTAATAASMARFEREVDPDGLLTPEERARRAGFARKSHFADLARRAAKARRIRGGRARGLLASRPSATGPMPDPPAAKA
jgi:hypothetical protein